MFIPNANMHNSGELYVIRRTGWVHLRSGRIAVALGVNFGLSIAFRNRATSGNLALLHGALPRPKSCRTGPSVYNYFHRKLFVHILICFGLVANATVLPILFHLARARAGVVTFGT